MLRVRSQCLALWGGLLVLGLAWPAVAAEPTLARLCFWVPPERKEEFAAEYRASIAPLLRQRGLRASSRQGRPTMDSVFSQLFEFATPAAFAAKASTLQGDEVFRKALQRLGSRFGSSASDTLRRSFALYERPLGPGVVAKAGPGRGRWQTYDAGESGLRGGVDAILEDRDGNLWFGSQPGGLSRYDGQTWTTFTARDGLPANDVGVLLQDRRGHIWAATGGGSELGNHIGGVSRFDGQTWTTFTTGDGLASNLVLAMIEDQQGNLWFGTDQGISRFDGQTWATFTSRDGLVAGALWLLLQDRHGHLWAASDGAYFDKQAGGVSRFDGQTWTTFTTRDGLASNLVQAMVEDQQGRLWFGTDRGVSRYDGQRWTTFTTRDGLVSGSIWALLTDRDGLVWLGSEDGGISRYDGQRFTTVAEPSASKAVNVMHQDREGYVWIGTGGSGVIRCAPAGAADPGPPGTRGFSTEDGLSGNTVFTMLEDREGNLWFGTNAGASRYEPQRLTSWSVRDGLPSNEPRAILVDRAGRVWTDFRTGEVSCFDGVTFTTVSQPQGSFVDQCMLEDRQGGIWFNSGWVPNSNEFVVSCVRGGVVTTFTAEDSLWGALLGQDRQGRLWFGTPGRLKCYDGRDTQAFDISHLLRVDMFTSMAEDRDGNLWFTSLDGLLRYDGQTWTTYTTQEGLPSNRVWSVLVDRRNHLWFSTWDGGLCRYDGRAFQTFTTADGLTTDLLLYGGAEDRAGNLWFPTDGGGAIRYDGQTFQSLSRQDGLAGNVVRFIAQDPRGDLWLTCSGGLTRYRPPPPSPPPVFIDAVVADRRYEGVSAVGLPSTTQLVAFEFHGRSFKTQPGAMAYRYRLVGHDEQWRTTQKTRVEYEELPRGTYTFEVQAVDRDLAYSEKPSTVAVVIEYPSGQLALIAGLGVAFAGLVIASGYGIRRRRERDQARETLVREMEAELQTAHDLQMGLMPKEPPRIPGLEIAGQCLPASHVGGDFFQYFQQHGTFSLCVADVTGHAMEAAIPVVMFSGVLHSEMRHQLPLEQLFANLNQTLHARLGSHTFVCFSMAQLNPLNRILRLANGGCPYPYHYRAVDQQVAELGLDTYPLGIRPDTTYQTIDVQLAPGDRVVFCSDGIIEAANGAGEMFGFERTAEVIRRGCAEGLSAEVLLERIMGEVKEYRGETPQGDDQTVVVLKVDDRRSA